MDGQRDKWEDNREDREEDNERRLIHLFTSPTRPWLCASCSSARAWRFSSLTLAPSPEHLASAAVSCFPVLECSGQGFGSVLSCLHASQSQSGVRPSWSLVLVSRELHRQSSLRPQQPQLVRLGLFLAPQKFSLCPAQHSVVTWVARGHKGEAKSSNTVLDRKLVLGGFPLFHPRARTPP